MWLWVLAAACVPNEADPSATDTALSAPSSEWSTAGFERALLSNMEVGLPLASAVRQSYFEVMELGDGSCPGGDGAQLTATVPVDGCTAESGAFFQGISTWTEIEQSDHRSWVLTGDFTMRDVDGVTFSGGGTATMIIGEGDHQLQRSVVSGTWSYAGGEGPLAAGYSAGEFAVTRTATTVLIDGGDSTENAAVDYDQLGYDLDCGGLLGEVAVRSPEGHWWSASFLAECSPCGTVFDEHDVEQGELCLEDLSAFDSAAADTGL